MYMPVFGRYPSTFPFTPRSSRCKARPSTVRAVSIIRHESGPTFCPRDSRGASSHSSHGFSAATCAGTTSGHNSTARTDTHKTTGLMSATPIPDLPHHGGDLNVGLLRLLDVILHRSVAEETVTAKLLGRGAEARRVFVARQLLVGLQQAQPPPGGGRRLAVVADAVPV